MAVAKQKLSKEEQEYAMFAMRFAELAKSQGCCQEQVENFLLANVILQKKQLEIAALCRSCDKPDGPKAILAGGGRGSGKSNAILAQIFCDDCQRVKGLKVLCLRKVGRANKEQIADFRKKLLMNLEHTYREQAQTIEFKNGSLVILGNFKDEKDIDKYLGLEYDLIYIMESNQLTQSKKINILSCLRTNKQNWRPRCYQDTNPGGIDHAANKVLFVDPWQKGTQTDTRYVHSTVDDNKFVDSGYKEFLEKLEGWQRKAWLEGSWDFMAGAFFSNFSPSINVYPNEKVNFDIHHARRWMGAFDHGFAHASAFVLVGEDREGIQYVVDVYSETEKVAEQNAEGIKYMLRQYGLTPDDLDFIAAGGDCFSRVEDGRTRAQMYEEYGLNFIRADTDRINGWARLREKFGNSMQGVKPSLYVHRRCLKLIEQIQVAQHSELKQGDIQKFNTNEDGEGGDDLLDATRFLFATDPNTSIKWAKPIAGFGYKMLGF